jgi:DNA-binding CsgD family transcriptional regulator
MRVRAGRFDGLRSTGKFGDSQLFEVVVRQRGLHTGARLCPALRRVSSRTRCFMRAMACGANGDVEIVLLAGTSELGLTTREGEVLAWLSKGKTNRDIAQILGLSPRTVDKHLEQIYAKLGVENRTAAAAIATNATRRNS